MARYFGNPISAMRSESFDRRWLVLTVTSIGSFMSLLDSTIVNIALPSILRRFHADLDNGQLVLTVYLLALAVVIPISGFLAERIGMKRLYLSTLVLFTLGSVLCGLAWNLPSLIVFRLMQGLGGGMLQPLGMAIVFTQITPLERGRFMGILGLPMLLAPILGPTVGGYLVEYSSWRTIFLINLPIGAVNLWLAMRLLSESPIRHDARLDTKGLALAIMAFPLLLLGLSQGEDRGWSSPLVLGMFIVGGLALAAFVVVERRHADPLLQVRLFERPMFALGMIINFVTQFSLFGLQFLLPLFLQTARGMSPANTGLVLFPSGVASFISMNVGGRLYNTVGPRKLVVAGLVLLLVTTLLLHGLTADTNVFEIVVLFSMRGMAMGFCMMPVQTAAYNSIPQHLMTRATALVNMLFRVFGSMATAILTTILVFSLQSQGAPPDASITRGTAPLPIMVEAFHDAFLAMSLLTVVGIALAMFLKDPVLEEFKATQAAGSAEPSESAKTELVTAE